MTRRSFALACALLFAGCGHLPSSRDQAARAAPTTLCVDTAGPTASALGEPDYLPVSPGDVVRGKAQLVTPRSANEPRRFRVLEQKRLRLGAADVEIWNLEEQRGGGGLVFIARDGGPPRVIATYALPPELYPRRMSILATWRRPDCAMAVLLVRDQEQSEPLDASSPAPRAARSNWLALGVAPDRVWRTSELLYAPVELYENNGWPELATTEGKKVRFVLLPETLRFVEQR